MAPFSFHGMVAFRFVKWNTAVNNSFIWTLRNNKLALHLYYEAIVQEYITKGETINPESLVNSVESKWNEHVIFALRFLQNIAKSFFKNPWLEILWKLKQMTVQRSASSEHCSLKFRRTICLLPLIANYYWLLARFWFKKKRIINCLLKTNWQYGFSWIDISVMW